MSVQYSDTYRNARLDLFETTLGASSVLEIRTLAPPANCAAGDAGSLLITLTMDAGGDFMNAASGGSVTKKGTWQGTASGAGTAAHFRFKTSGGTTHMQGTIGAGSGDLSLDNTSIAIGQVLTISTWQITSGNA